MSAHWSDNVSGCITFHRLYWLLGMRSFFIPQQRLGSSWAIQFDVLHFAPFFFSSLSDKPTYWINVPVGSEEPVIWLGMDSYLVGLKGWSIYRGMVWKMKASRQVLPIHSCWSGAYCPTSSSRSSILLHVKFQKWCRMPHVTRSPMSLPIQKKTRLSQHVQFEPIIQFRFRILMARCHVVDISMFQILMACCHVAEFPCSCSWTALLAVGSWKIFPVAVPGNTSLQSR